MALAAEVIDDHVVGRQFSDIRAKIYGGGGADSRSHRRRYTTYLSYIAFLRRFNLLLQLCNLMIESGSFDQRQHAD